MFGGSKKEICKEFTEQPETRPVYSTYCSQYLIGEGEIEGFAKQPLQSILADNVAIQNDIGQVNFAKVDVAYRFGSPFQTPVSMNVGDAGNFGAIARTIPIGKPMKSDVVINDPPWGHHGIHRNHAIYQFRGVNRNLGVTHRVLDKNVTRIVAGIKLDRLFYHYYDGTGNSAIVPWKVTISCYVDETHFAVWSWEEKAMHSPTIVEVSINQSYIQSRLQNRGFVDITFVKETPECYSTDKANAVSIEYVREHIDYSLTHPNTAYVTIALDSRHFTRLPSFGFHVKGLKIRVPSNYNPTTRTYDGIWDGSFSAPVYSNNPAWCLYDLISSGRYGLGSQVRMMELDKWELYEIGKYCDELVDDGEGVLEPRFTLNLVLNQQQEALKVIGDICNVFRAMPVWYGNRMTFSQDRPKQSRMLFNSSNVAAEGFSYTTSDSNNRYTRAVVHYLNAKYKYQKEVAFAEDYDAMRKYGDRLAEMTAFGVTSRGQAMRVAEWIVKSSAYQTNLISFRTGLEALSLKVGDVFTVIDNARYTFAVGGRCSNVSEDKTTLTLDTEIYLDPDRVNSIYVLALKDLPQFSQVNSSEMFAQYNQSHVQFRNLIVTSRGNSKTVSFETPLNVETSDPSNIVWVLKSTAYDVSNNYYSDQNAFDEMLESMRLAYGNQLRATNIYQATPLEYQLISIKESDKGYYELVGLEYWNEKFDAIEKGFEIVEPEEVKLISKDYDSVTVLPPSNFTPTTSSIDGNNTVVLTWDESQSKEFWGDKLKYEISMLESAGVNHSPIILTTTSLLTYTVSGLGTGTYQFLIKSIVEESDLASSVVTTVASFNLDYIAYGDGLIPIVSDLQLLTDNENPLIFESDSASFAWSLEDTTAAEKAEHYVVEIYDTSGNLKREERITGGNNMSYSYSMSNNISDNSTPLRSFGIRVGAEVISGEVVGKSSLLPVSNPPPPAIPDNGWILGSGHNIATVSIPLFETDQQIDENYPEDIAGNIIYYSQSAFGTGDIASNGSPLTPDIFSIDNSTLSTYLSIPIPPGITYYFRTAAYDSFGKYNLILSNQKDVKALGADIVSPGDPSNLIMSSVLNTGDRGYKSLDLSLAWNAASNASYYVIGVKESGAMDYIDYVAASTLYQIKSVKPNKNYLGRVRAVSSSSIFSNWVTGNHTTSNIAVATSMPIGSVLLLPSGQIPSDYEGIFEYCQGQSLNTGSYNELFNVIGYTFGGTGSQFLLPSGQYNDNVHFVMRVS